MTRSTPRKLGKTPVKLPAHELVYRKIRDKVLFGDLSPGQAVTIQGLAEEIGVSMTPVREAIRRLTAAGALEFMGNRRVTVPQMDENSFAELVFAREAVEPQLARQACMRVNSQVISQLRAIDQEVNQAIEAGDVPEYMYQNYRFHFMLYRHADSAILEPMAQTLWLRYGPLYRIICGKWGTANMVDLHAETVSALEKGDAEATAKAILLDVQQGFEIIRNSFQWS